MNKKTLKYYIEEIEKCRFYDPQRMLKLSHSMISLGKKNKDDKLRAYGEYYLLEAFFRLGSLNEKSLKHSVAAIQFSKSAKLYELECRCYNMMGIFLNHQGDDITALEFYQKGMELASKHRYSGMVRILTNNIGDIYLRLGEYHTALTYFNKSYERAMECYQQQDKSNKKKINVITLNIGLLNISELYYRMGDYEKSLSYLNMLFPDEESNKKAYYSAAVEAMYAINYLCLNQKEDAEPYIDKTIAAAESSYEAVESVKDYINLCNVLIESDELEKAARMQTATEKIAKDLDLVSIWCEYYEVAIKFAKATSKDTILPELYAKYFECKKLQEKSLKQQQLRALKNKQELNKAVRRQEQMEKRNQELQCMSEHDALTGLYNRYVLNPACDAWYKEAVETNGTLGIIVLDIDYFKEFNDMYGHLQGDECLRDVSDVLTESVENDEIIARYGGDEFFILIKNKSEEEILEYARKIGSRMREKKIRHDASKISQYVSLSIGIANGTPKETQSVLDIIHYADNALYKAKEEKRGSIGVHLGNGEYKVYQA